MRQPVPELRLTLEKYVQSIKPLLTERELNRTMKAVEDFGRVEGIGEKLQKLLCERAQCMENWLADWWLNAAYLDFRLPVVVYSSPGLYFPRQKFETEADRLKYAAKVILAASDYKVLIDKYVCATSAQLVNNFFPFQ